MLTSTKFVVTEQTKMLSAKGVYDIIDGDTKKPLGTAAVRNPGLMSTLFGALIGKDRMTTTIDIRQKPDDAIVFSIRRKGWFFSKVQLLDGQGQVIAEVLQSSASFQQTVYTIAAGGQELCRLTAVMGATAASAEVQIEFLSAAVGRLNRSLAIALAPLVEERARRRRWA